jgi:hypothetical protein
MHTIKANGGRLTILHQRSFEEIHDRPHITRWVGHDHGQPMAKWAVYYLLGRQSRIRCNLHDTLRGAIQQATRVAHMNMGATRCLQRERRAA